MKLLPTDVLKSFLSLGPFQLTAAVAVAAVTAVAISTFVTGVASGEDPRPWEPNLRHQLEDTEVRDSEVVVVVFLGVSDRYPDANLVREFWATELRPDFPKVGVIVVPTYGGVGVLEQEPKWLRIARDIGASVRRHFGLSDSEVASALETIRDHHKPVLAMVCHSGATYPCNEQHADVIEALRSQELRPAIGFMNGNLQPEAQRAYEGAGIDAYPIEEDWITYITRPSREYPLGRAGKLIAFAIGLLDFAVDEHSSMTQAKTDETTQRLNLERRYREALDDSPSSVLESSESDAEHAPVDNDRPKYVLEPPPPGGPGALNEPGGIDFRDVELRYLSEEDRPDGPLLTAAFNAPQGTPTDASWGAFFTWLALPDETFWVNLNPDEPDRIIDPRLGVTETGRVLLEADFQLKRDLAELTRPDTGVGGEFWAGIDALLHAAGANGVEFVYRVWVVPGRVTAWENADEVYVVEALLDVRFELEMVDAYGSSGSIVARDIELEEYLDAFFEREFVPVLRLSVNSEGVYAPLRQVFYARVVAEWYKSTHMLGTASYASAIDTGDVSSFVVTDGWRPGDTYSEYVESFERGEYIFSGPNGQLYFTGGVDLTRLAIEPISQVRALEADPEGTYLLRELAPRGRGRPSGGGWLEEIFIGEPRASAPDGSQGPPSLIAPDPQFRNTLHAQWWSSW